MNAGTGHGDPSRAGEREPLRVEQVLCRAILVAPYALVRGTEFAHLPKQFVRISLRLPFPPLVRCLLNAGRWVEPPSATPGYRCNILASCSVLRCVLRLRYAHRGTESVSLMMTVRLHRRHFWHVYRYKRSVFSCSRPLVEHFVFALRHGMFFLPASGGRLLAREPLRHVLFVHFYASTSPTITASYHSGEQRTNDPFLGHFIFISFPGHRFCGP